MVIMTAKVSKRKMLLVLLLLVLAAAVLPRLRPMKRAWRFWSSSAGR